MRRIKQLSDLYKWNGNMHEVSIPTGYIDIYSKAHMKNSSPPFDILRSEEQLIGYKKIDNNKYHLKYKMNRISTHPLLKTLHSIARIHINLKDVINIISKRV